MIALLQRVNDARVIVHGETVGEIGRGLLVLVCAEAGDGPPERDKLLAKILKLRIFSDAAGKMNHSVQDMDGLGFKVVEIIERSGHIVDDLYLPDGRAVTGDRRQ